MFQTLEHRLATSYKVKNILPYDSTITHESNCIRQGKACFYQKKIFQNDSFIHNGTHNSQTMETAGIPQQVVDKQFVWLHPAELSNEIQLRISVKCG